MRPVLSKEKKAPPGNKDKKLNMKEQILFETWLYTSIFFSNMSNFIKEKILSLVKYINLFKENDTSISPTLTLSK